MKHFSVKSSEVQVTVTWVDLANMPDFSSYRPCEILPWSHTRHSGHTVRSGSLCFAVTTHCTKVLLLVRGNVPLQATVLRACDARVPPLVTTKREVFQSYFLYSPGTLHRRHRRQPNANFFRRQVENCERQHLSVDVLLPNTGTPQPSCSAPPQTCHAVPPTCTAAPVGDAMVAAAVDAAAANK